jgi:hypothetical protein
MRGHQDGVADHVVTDAANGRGAGPVFLFSSPDCGNRRAQMSFLEQVDGPRPPPIPPLLSGHGGTPAGYPIDRRRPGDKVEAAN